MSKIFKIYLFLICILLLFCMGGCGGMPIFDDSEAKADTRLEKLLEVLAHKDDDALKKIFSKQALDDAVNFDKNSEYLFELFQGNIVSWVRDSISGGTKIEYGKKSVQLRSWYTVTTDKEEYLFLVIDYIQDTINPDNAGLYTLRVVRVEDAEIQFSGYWQDMEIAGIYRPE